MTDPDPDAVRASVSQMIGDAGEGVSPRKAFGRAARWSHSR